MSTPPRALARVAAAVVLGRWDELRRLRRAHAPDRAWRETLLQTYLFAGFPRVVEAFRVLDEEGGLGAAGPEEGEIEGEVEEGTPEERGRALFERIYGSNAPAVRETLEASHPVFAGWIERHAYGRVLARGGLTAAERECLAVASLSALGQERQLAAHLRGGLRCGASAAELRDALDAVADLVGAERAARARRVADEYAPLGNG